MQKSDIRLISTIVQEHDLLLDPSDPMSTDQYDILNYPPFGHTSIVALLDRQIISYLVRILKSQDISEGPDTKILRATAALQAFLAITNIISEPGLAYNEYADTQGMEKADNELSLFRSADNVDCEIWKGIAIGESKNIPSEAIPTFKTGELIGACVNEKVRDFEYNLTIVKKAMIIKRLGLSGFESVIKLMDWMHTDYISTTPSLFFMILHFSNHPVPRMIKGKSEKAARNAAWDLCALQNWRSISIKYEANRFYLASFDKAIKLVAVMMFPTQQESNDEYKLRIRNNIINLYGKNTGAGKNVFDKFESLQENIDDPRRAHNQNNNFQNHDFILDVRGKVDAEFKEKAAV